MFLFEKILFRWHCHMVHDVLSPCAACKRLGVTLARKLLQDGMLRVRATVRPSPQGCHGLIAVPLVLTLRRTRPRMRGPYLVEVRLINPFKWFGPILLPRHRLDVN